MKNANNYIKTIRGYNLRLPKTIVTSAVFLYDFLGLKCIWDKVNPPVDEKGQREPRTILLWLLGIYVSLFGLASSRFEQILSRLENRVNFIISQADTENWKSLAREIPNLQHTKIPLPPTITNPLTVIFSFFNNYNESDKQIINELQSLIYRKRNNLGKTNLTNLILTNEIDLIKNEISGKNFQVNTIKERSFARSNFHDTILNNAELQNIDFYRSDFSNSIMSHVNMQNCNLSYANLNNTILKEANLRKSNLLHANLENAVLEQTNLEDAILIGIDLSETHNLDTANLKGALYNSAAVSLKKIPTMQEIQTFCEKNDIPQEFVNYIAENINSIYERPTKFPDGFNPYQMTDINKLITTKQIAKFNSK